VVELDPEIRAFYELGKEADRLSSTMHPSGPLEFARTQELILRHLPEGHLKILDVGRGPGTYAEWLSALGHQVSIIDPVVLHVQQASTRGVAAELGDARDIDRPSHSVDVALLPGPLYHLVDPVDRMRTLAEARRVVKPGGVIFAAAISRFAALLDLLVRLDCLHEEHSYDTVAVSLATGVFGGGDSGLFTTSFLHRPHDLRREAEEAGLTEVRIFNVEGPGFMVNDFAERWSDPDRREVLLRAARVIEEDADMLAAASHLLLVARN
jgi:SAM-dependent methyltransferase